MKLLLLACVFVVETRGGAVSLRAAVEAAAATEWGGQLAWGSSCMPVSVCNYTPEDCAKKDCSKCAGEAFGTTWYTNLGKELPTPRCGTQRKSYKAGTPCDGLGCALCVNGFESSKCK
jgi:hypothetical protein